MGALIRVKLPSSTSEQVNGQFFYSRRGNRKLAKVMRGVTLLEMVLVIVILGVLHPSAR